MYLHKRSYSGEPVSASHQLNRSRIIEFTGVYLYSQTSLIRTPQGQNQVSALQRCPYYRGRECMIFGISGTKQTVRNREVSVRRG